jgi:hypothetical protein
LLNIDGVKCKEVTLATSRKKKEVQVKQKKRYCEFWRWRNWRKYTIKYTCCKSKFAISKQKDVISASYDTNQTIWMGYNFSILNIKGNKMHIYFVVYLILIYSILQ